MKVSASPPHWLRRAGTAVRTGARRRLVTLGARLVLGLACLALLAAAYPVAMTVEEWRQQVTPQYNTPPTQFSAAQLARYRQAAATPTDPVVVSYHDIDPDPNGNPYVVTPATFDAQMRMLTEAGYHPLTAEQFVDYLRGGTVPDRSALITFDDGTHGLWTYADRILARYDLHAVAFLITDAVGTHRPYYLSWREVARMHESGRWDFGSHTSDLHRRVRIDESGRRGSALANRRYLETEGRLESVAEYKRRVRADLEKSIRDITDHGLPRPRLFVFPFSELTDPEDGDAADRFLHREVHRLFGAALANQRPRPGAVSRRAAEERLIERGEVMSDTTAEELFRLLRVMSTLHLTDHDPTAHVDRWLTEGGYRAPVRSRHGVLRPDPGEDTFVRAYYAPQRTGDWVDYRVRVDVTGFDPWNHRTVTGALTARAGSASQIDVKVSARTLQVTIRDGNTMRKVVDQNLNPGPSHSVSIRTADGHTAVVVDGEVRYWQRVAPGPASTGGIAVSAYRGDAGADFPAFENLRVTSGA